MNKSFKYVSNRVWSRYKRIITTFLDNDAGRQDILWAHRLDQLTPFGEDYKPGYFLRTIEALCYYNAFRNWPINRETPSGELDEENLSIIISKQYLESRGYLNAQGYFDFDWSSDRFVINGITYKPSGDTEVAQAKDEALAFLIILKRDMDSELGTQIMNWVFDENNQLVFTDKNQVSYVLIRE